MDDNLLVPPGRRPTRYRWLKENFEDRTVAELSVWFCIAATGSFIVAVLFLPVLGGICGLAGVSVELIVWLGSLAWLARSFVRIARGWGSDRLGAETFAAMQRVFLVMTALTLSLIHISEPTRLLSISYAVFCLKKKKHLHTQ